MTFVSMYSAEIYYFFINDKKTPFNVQLMLTFQGVV